ncbi:MAG: hypothetical protein IPH48_01270 [bacterium]|nr:hypothetical protein [bacterium]
MVADVPLGVFLSGGLDSSAVTSCAAEASDSPARTFAVGMAGDGWTSGPWPASWPNAAAPTTGIVVRGDVADALPC